MRWFYVTLQGRHFAIPVENGGMARGFLAFRKVLAADEVQAKERAADVLLGEERVQEFIRLTEASAEEARWFVRAEKVSELTFLGRLFWRMPTGFILYERES